MRVRLWLLFYFVRIRRIPPSTHRHALDCNVEYCRQADCDADRDDVVWGPACLFGADDSVSVKGANWDHGPRSAVAILCLPFFGGFHAYLLIAKGFCLCYNLSSASAGGVAPILECTET